MARASSAAAVSIMSLGLIATGAVPATSQTGMACLYRGEASRLASRPSPLDSVMFQVEGHDVKICYGRPSARGRTMIGGEAVPYGEIWRSGANEVTLLRTTADLDIAGIEVPAGTYSFYTVPGEDEWGIIVNRSYSQWGHTRTYTPEVEAQEVGRGAAPSEGTEEHIEMFTIRAGVGEIILEWENTRVVVPVSASSS